MSVMGGLQRLVRPCELKVRESQITEKRRSFGGRSLKCSVDSLEESMREFLVEEAPVKVEGHDSSLADALHPEY